MSLRHLCRWLVLAAALVLAPGAPAVPEEGLTHESLETGVWTDWLHAGESVSVPAPTTYEIPANQTVLPWPFNRGWLLTQGSLRSVGTTLYQIGGGGVQGEAVLRGSDEGAALRLDFDPVLEPAAGYRPIYTALVGADVFHWNSGTMARVTGVDSNSSPNRIVAEIFSVVDGEVEDTLAFEVTDFDTAEGMVLMGGELFLVVDGELEQVAQGAVFSSEGLVGVGIETEAGHELDHGISAISVDRTAEWMAGLGTGFLHRDLTLSDWLRAYDFGFGSEIPPGSTILGVEVRSTQWTEGSTPEQLLVESVRLWPDDGPEGEDRSTGAYWSNPADEGNPIAYTYGGASDLWGLSLTRADVVAEDFGWAQRGLLDTYNGSLAVDSMEMRIRYQPE